jgi:hypothetical protein
MRWIIFFSLFFVFVGCSGYRFSQQENPLAQYGIYSLSVPMFYNYSNIPDASPEFTREVYRLLTGFSGLRLKSGYNQDADAVLIGIVKSAEKMSETLRPTSPRVAKDRAQESVGTERQPFNIPGANQFTLMVHVIVIKKPTEEELALLRSSLGEKVALKSKVIFNEVIPVQIQMTREVLDNAGTQVVATQNLGIQRKTVRELSVMAANSIRDLILYAF